MKVGIWVVLGILSFGLIGRVVTEKWLLNQTYINSEMDCTVYTDRHTFHDCLRTKRYAKYAIRKRLDYESKAE